MCDCIQKLNDALEPEGARLAMGTQVTPDLQLRGRLLIQVEKTDQKSRKKLPNVVASHCPFCGSKFED